MLLFTDFFGSSLGSGFRIRIRIRIRTRNVYFGSGSDPDRAKSFGSLRVRIRIRNTAFGGICAAINLHFYFIYSFKYALTRLVSCTTTPCTHPASYPFQVLYRCRSDTRNKFYCRLHPLASPRPT
jgi:hypothetical protein